MDGLILTQKKLKDNLEEYYKLIDKNCSTIDNDAIIKYEDMRMSKLQFINGFKCKPGIHIGQRKLFLSEMQFLTNVYLKNPTWLKSKKQIYCVYAGAAPGHHTWFLSNFFPHVTFILIDPNKFDLFDNDINTIEANKNNVIFTLYDTKTNIPTTKWIEFILSQKYKIYLVQDYFTDSLAQLFSELNPIFMSDIRSNEDQESEPTDLDFIWNCAQQYNWLNIIKPMASMLKFRVPFFESAKLNLDSPSSSIKLKDFNLAKNYGIDFVTDYNNRKFRYPSGQIYLQAFPGNASSESRLCMYDAKKLKIVDYDCVEYENKFFLYNILDRMLVHRKNLFSDKKLGFDHCNDCAIECNIWAEYYKLYPKYDVRHTVNMLTNHLKRPLAQQSHGHFFVPNVEYLHGCLNYNHIDPNKLRISEIKKKPKSISDKNNLKSAQSINFLLDQLSGKLPDDAKKLYNAAALATFKVVRKPFYDLHGYKESFPVAVYARIFKPTYKNRSFSYFASIFQFLCFINVTNLTICIDKDKNKYLLAADVEKLEKLFSINICVVDGLDGIAANKNMALYIDLCHLPPFPEYEAHMAGAIRRKIAEIGAEYTLWRTSTMVRGGGGEIYNKNKQPTTQVHKNKQPTTPTTQAEYFPLSYDTKIFDYKIFPGKCIIAPYDYETVTPVIYLFEKKDLGKSKETAHAAIAKKHMHFSTFARTFAKLENDNVDYKIGFDNCYDCAMMNYFVKEYCMKYKKNVREILRYVLPGHLFNNGHGYLTHAIGMGDYLNVVYREGFKHT